MCIRDSLPACPEEVADHQVEGHAEDRSDDVVEEKGAVAHAAYASGNRADGFDHRDEASEEDGLAAMVVEIPLGPFQVGFLEEEVAPVAADEVDASITPDEITDAVATDGADRSDSYEQPQVKASTGGDQSRYQQRHITGHDQADERGILQEGYQQDYPVAPVFQLRQDEVDYAFQERSPSQ